MFLSYTNPKGRVHTLDNQLIQLKSRQLKAMVYVDYENILELLKVYGKDPLEIDFFRVIQARLAVAGVKIIDIMVYGNFEKKTAGGNQQTFLRAMGLQTRHASNNGKNSGDLELTVDALKDLFKNPSIDIFVIISSDRDIIPLLKAIKYENKLSYVYSTQNGFNQIVAKYADFHEYIEAIFQLVLPEPPRLIQGLAGGPGDIDPETVNPENIQQAREVAHYFYHSRIWAKSSILGKPVSLKGYLDVVARVVKRSPENVFNDFKLAHSLKLITIYRDPERGLCLKEGEQMENIR
jgi:uncharacterized LabA/DUF88 family protein